MSLTDMVCPKCGISSKDRKFVKFLCQDCWVRQQKIKLPEKIIIETCKKCGKVKIRSWMINFNNLKDEIVPMCKWQSEQVCVGIPEFTMKACRVRLRLGEVEIERDIPVKVNRTLCPDCTKIARGYYEAVIQLRSEEGKVTPRLESLKEKLTRLLENVTFISKAEDFKYGFDIYVGSTTAVYSTLREAGQKYLTTTSLVTQKAGKELHRTTFLIKI